jgi:chromosome segregation ATPase
MHDDPEFIESLQKLFATRSDIRSIADYQQKLYASLSELNASHRAIHDHVRGLTESHNRSQTNTDALIRARGDLERLLRSLEQAHAQTQTEVRRASQDLYQIQQHIRKIPEIEQRLEKLEQEIGRLQRDERRDEHKDSEHDRRLNELERRDERKDDEHDKRLHNLERRFP